MKNQTHKNGQISKNTITHSLINDVKGVVIAQKNNLHLNIILKHT